mgnify:FL=1|jgi:hypothetical protein
MFKKPENIQPLPAGMVDAFTAKVASQGYKMPEAEPVAEAEVEVEAQPEEVSEAVASRGVDKTKPGDGDTKMPKVADVTPEIGMISSKDKAAKSVETAVKAASKSQHEETEGFEIIQDGGKVEVEDVMYEATIKVKAFTGKAPAGIKVKKIASSSMGGNDVEMTGPDAKLIAYAKKSLGCDASCKTIADVEKSLSEVYESSCSTVSSSYKPKAKKEEIDPVNPKAVKKKFDDRKDKDIDNDGDEDESDEYLHRRRKAISKALED